MARFEHPLTRIDEIPLEGSKVVDLFGRKAHVVRGADGHPAAFMDVCMHLGGPMSCEDGIFRCEWHGATFDVRTGLRTAGPGGARARLLRLPTIVKDDVLTYVWG